ncbi:Meiotic coiled-coil protein 2 [Pseudocercospora fuligena]|uniref:Meiotic coiled-coil protein 2 n=1 Tax=Pseudocercospora fuligena TaxID=685502 RepID=A0A8H6VL04_9PEZI|nr:Meiotic coiled-coil protein 2 [Pseudocercospora fuligena]
MEWTGSPTKKASASFSIYDENTNDQQLGLKRTSSALPLPLTTSRLANRGPPPQARLPPANKFNPFLPGSADTYQPKPNMAVSAAPMTDILGKLNLQQDLLSRQKRELDENKSTSSSATDPYAQTPPTETSDGRPDSAQVLHLQKQLQQANERMAEMGLQLTQSRLAQHTMQEAIGSPFPAAQHLAANIPDQAFMPSSNGLVQAAKYSRPTSPFERGSFNMSQQSFDSMPGFTRTQSSFNSSFNSRNGYTPPITPMPFQQQQPFPPPNNGGYPQQAPVGTRLSATAAEFGVGRGQWAMQPQHQPLSYASTTEPLNYRRLLDRNMSCNWKYIVDKIVCNNDQQASIFLQQKLKQGTHEQKFEIVQAIIDQAYPLMVNRFGNFLVQRCFEHGTPEQVVAIAQAIRGNTLNLSMDAFGCHVVQKAFDCVPEEYKAIMVHELLRRIPETVIHRYACHVWQKLFELRWSDSPPQIMKYVNEALRGMWHEVALGETGSLVVQNIFENCLVEDKRPCINEVLSSIDVVAHGQFGNWCIQHICEHGSIPDRTRAIDHVIRFASEYSMDQFASKVVEKCLKIGGSDFLDRYLDRVCEARPDRPRMPLIDISGDQFGNYLIQYILTHGDPERREIVAAHIRKHMVSLRGSKYGSRVAMLCCNPAVATRPGPPAGLPMHRNNGGYGSDHHFGQGPPRPYGNDRPPYMGRGDYGGAYR